MMRTSAASKARGMWMGGVPPLGYAPNGRTLLIVEEQAALVRLIFDRYLALGSVRLLQDELQRSRTIVPVRQTGSGRSLGGRPFTRGQLYFLLKNLIYVGRIPHREVSFEGLHPAIVARDTFDRAQALLKAHVQGGDRRSRALKHSPLAGKIVDADGEPLLTTHAIKRKARYRYYVSRGLHHKTSDIGLRLPAREVETLVANALAELFVDPIALITRVSLDVAPHHLPILQVCCAALAASLKRPGAPEVSDLLERVRIGDAKVTIDIRCAAIAALLDLPSPEATPPFLQIDIAVELKRSGTAMKMVLPSGHAARPVIDEKLVKQLIVARRWWHALRQGQVDITRLATSEGVTPSYMTRLLRLTFLSPAVVDAIVHGRQRAGMSTASLFKSDAIPPRWAEQKRMLLPAEV